ncbi:MAG: primosomal protein N' [Eggerthellaceae bacterium]|nr:primosomal protein N' [Eggerthellaceae bacterium]
MRFASVTLDIPATSLDDAFTYALPDDGCVDGTPALIGCAVVVPFGKRHVIGFVTDDKAEAPAIDPSKIKSVEKVVSESFFDERAVVTAKYLAKHCIAPLSSCIRLFTPPAAIPKVVEGPDGHYEIVRPSVSAADDRWVVKGPNFERFVARKNAAKQSSIVAALSKGDLRAVELSLEYGSVASALSSLEKSGVISIEHRRRMRMGDMPEGDKNFVPSAKPKLTAGQSLALDAISEGIHAQEGRVFLLDGVTGSGKTEVYLRAIEEALSMGMDACVLVPEISLTPQTVARFRGRFGDVVAVIHSAMSQGERFDQWDFIKSGRARVVVGARSALFAPFGNLGLVVIDEEHEYSYKQDQAPRYHSRDVATWMMDRFKGMLILGSATPSLESLHRCQTDGSWQRLVLSERANKKPLPPIEVIDMTAEFKGGLRSMYSKRLLFALKQELLAGNKAVLLLNQRGFANFVMCRECGYVPMCPSCSTSLTYHEYGKRLTCHHCNHQEHLLAACPQCGSPYLMKYGFGTQQAEIYLRSWLDADSNLGSGIPLIRMDADTTSAKGAHQKLLGQFADAGAAVLLGTQMIAKGLDFEKVTLVGVINADTQLKLPDFRAGERTYSLILQVAGRAGRADLPGKVYVQTYRANERAIVAASTYNRELFMDEELKMRSILNYPPYCVMANVLVWGSSQSKTASVAQSAYADLEPIIDGMGEGWSISMPCPCVLAKVRGAYRYHMLIKAPYSADISSAVIGYFKEKKTVEDVNVTIDINPIDIL